jgi:hypothetical protein
VFRVGPSNEVTGTPTEYGLRLLVEPRVPANQVPVTTAWRETPGASRTA